MVNEVTREREREREREITTAIILRNASKQQKNNKHASRKEEIVRHSHNYYDRRR
jgi:hypothetical protein